MATNQNAPFGFRYATSIDGQTTNYGFYTGQINAANTNRIFQGDVLKPVSGGYFDVQSVTGGGETIGGIAWGFSWLSKAFGCRIWRPYWPGAGDANGPVGVMVINHPEAILEVQCVTGPITQANVGEYANFNVGGGGNTYSGVSSFMIDDGTLSAVQGNLPFQIYRVFDNESNPILPMPGYDPSNAYNRVWVKFTPQLVSI